jgi:hypothetical protein
MAPALARMLEPVHLEAAGTKNRKGWLLRYLKIFPHLDA